MKTLRVATCQFPVEGEIGANRRWVLRQIETAARREAEVVHFSETALSGYAGVDLPGCADIDWDELSSATRDVLAVRRHRLWVLLGSTHRLCGAHKPHNCVYAIDSRGEIVDRYDKRFCTGANGRTATLDLAHYSPGDHLTTFRVKGIACGVLICYDYRFPEVFREYKKLGTQVLFHSFHNARKTVVKDPRYNIWKWIVPATMACRAAENHFWISANNSTTRPSCWPSFAVRPDGLIVGKLQRHKPGVLVTEMMIDPRLFDAPGAWRDNAMCGKLHSGTIIEDSRSADRQCL